MHVAQQLRNSFTELIKTITAFETVNESRIHPLVSKQLPAALIFTENEIIENVTKQASIQRRMIETSVYVFARSQDKVENSLDELRKEVEKIILAESEIIKSVAYWTVLRETNMLLGGDDQDPVGAARMSFISNVLTKTGDPENPVKNSGGIFS